MARLIAVLPGDGIGREVVREACRILEIVNRKAGAALAMEEALCGGAAIDEAGSPLPVETVRLCEQSNAILLGAVGGPKWDPLDLARRPEQAVLRLRKELDLFANLRPAKLYGPLVSSSPLRREIAEGVDVMVVRELTSGIYFGEPRGVSVEGGRRVGRNTMVYREDEIRRIAKVAFDVSRERRRKVSSVDKANVLETMRLWREVVTDVGAGYPDVVLEHLYVDNCAMALVTSPRRFDVILTGNMFGDILSDEAAVLSGSIGMLPSASIGGSVGLYEPIHGSAPDIAGKDVANPIASIMSAAMMLRYAFGMGDVAERIESAVVAVLARGYRTKDIAAENATVVGTRAMGDLIAEELDATL